MKSVFLFDVFYRTIVKRIGQNLMEIVQMLYALHSEIYCFNMA